MRATSLDDMMAFLVFARVVESGSFTAAARDLGISKSAVSERISELEARLGVRLLHRSTRRLGLTTDGDEVFSRCARMIAAAEDARSVATASGKEVRGTLRVTAPVQLGQMFIGPATAAFARAHPAVRVELVLIDTLVDVITDRIDVAVRFVGRLASSDYHAHRLATDLKLICAAPAYIAAHGAPASPLDLAGHNCLRFSPVDARDEWSFRGKPGAARPVVSGSFATNDIDALRHAAIAGVGIAVLPRSSVAPDLATGRLIALLSDHPLTELGIYALHAPGRRTPPKIRAYVRALSRYFRGDTWLQTGSETRAWATLAP